MTRRRVLPMTAPSDLLDALDVAAKRRGTSVERFIDEALVAELPALVAEVVRAALSAEVSPDAATPPVGTSGATNDMTGDTVTASILPGDLDNEAPGRGAR